MFLDILQEDIEAFRSRGQTVIIEGSRLKGKIAIVPIVTDKPSDCTRYTPEEVAYLCSLDESEAIKVHEMKRIFGGSVKPL